VNVTDAAAFFGAHGLVLGLLLIRGLFGRFTGV